MKNIFKYPFFMFVGGTVYYGLEVINRGFSHWTMAVVGGICFVLIGLLNERNLWNLSIIGQMGISSLIITVIELISGVILNVWLGLNIWDYSDIPFNLLGQICLPFTILWFFLSYPAILLNNDLRNWFMIGENPQY